MKDDSDCCSGPWLESCAATMFCWGCATVQAKAELKVWYGHAKEGKPVHAGSPAAKKMARS